MKEKFIDIIHKFILDNYQDEKLDISLLVSELGFSRSKIYRKVKIATGKSINQLIREVRLEKAKEFFTSEDITANEVAYKVGFSSPQYFSKCFHDYYGITPGEFKNKEDEILLPVKKSKIKKLLIIVIAVIALAISIGYQFIETTNSASISRNIQTITVLPFEDLTEDNTKGFWCRGFEMEIINKLSKVSGLVIVEESSSSTLKEKGKSLPELSRKLGINYFLKASIRHFVDSLIIDVQLINSKGVYIWSGNYKRLDTDYFYSQQDIANDILNHLDIQLNPQEKLAFEKRPSENFEANKYFNKGLVSHESGIPKDIKTSIELFNEAIRLDSTFADAYAYLGNMYVYSTKDYITGSHFMDKDSAKALAIYNFNRASELNPNCIMSYIGLAELYMWERNIPKAQENFDKAYEINPNHTELNEKLANFYNYFSSPNDVKKFLVHIKKAYTGKPTSPRVILKLSQAYLYNGDIQEAEKILSKKSDILTNSQKFEIQGLINSYKSKNLIELIKTFEKGVKEHPNEAILFMELTFFYKGILVDRKKALLSAERAYQLDSLNLQYALNYANLLFINNDTLKARAILTNLHSEKRIYESTKNYYLSKMKVLTGDYEGALKIVMALPKRYLLEKAEINYYLGNFTKVKEFLKWYHPDYARDKALKFAILKERDSMYYYLDKLIDYDVLRSSNSSHVFDFYRHETRYKSYLRKKYLPISDYYPGLTIPLQNTSIN